ncbi:hypothetical protein Tco_0925113 [Tanacetum coccineum]|uniref:Uncharacterized protein n=1 Tax=Tanacetum coccineum TaxID=301880 RepID=A0ABQ5DC48_9ASTR
MANVTSLLTSLCNNFKNSASTSNSGTLPSQTVTNPREHVNAITTRSGKTLEGPSTPLVPTPVVSIPSKEPEQNPETSTDKVAKPSCSKDVQTTPFRDWIERCSRRNAKVQQWITRCKEQRETEEIAITTENAKCSAIIMNKVSLRSSKIRENYLIPINDASHNLASEVISDHEPEQNESSITFSPRSDPLHHEFAGEVITLPSRNDREFGEYLSLMTVLCEISTSQSQENVHANQSSIIESLPVSPIPVEDSEPAQEEIDIFLVPDDLIPPGVENDDSEDEQ